MKVKDSKLFQKLKSVKHIEYIILGIFLSVARLIAFSGSLSAKGESSTVFDLNEYAKQAEARLNESLSRIAGAGEVKTMITYECGIEYVPAFSEDKQTTTGADGNKNTSEKNTIIMSGGKPVILKEIEPKVKGVVVVAQGANDARVKLELYKAVMTLLGVESSDIEIFAMSK